MCSQTKALGMYSIIALRHLAKDFFYLQATDRGHISQALFEMLFVDDIHLVTKIKKNMKNSLMNLYDKLMLRKRSVIETVNDELKKQTYCIKLTSNSRYT